MGRISVRRLERRIEKVSSALKRQSKIPHVPAMSSRKISNPSKNLLRNAANGYSGKRKSALPDRRRKSDESQTVPTAQKSSEVRAAFCLINAQCAVACFAFLSWLYCCPAPAAATRWKCTQTVPNEPQTIGDHIKARRIALHLFRRDVAKRIGVTWRLSRTGNAISGRCPVRRPRTPSKNGLTALDSADPPLP
jgi:hypothetical protein